MSLHAFSSPTAQKRGPSTPLMSSNHPKRQQFVQKTPQKEILTIHATDYQRELLMCKYNLWLTQKELDKEKELREFLELERRMNEDEGETSDKIV
ncbi:hypothetical protein CJJ07_005029 [Candidozyma auris]|nr:hypothetical protein CJJ07_005029 [[Candida] auris]QEL60664.1 hypothetical protein CJJ09_002778 [[Candida] auris]